MERRGGVAGSLGNDTVVAERTIVIQRIEGGVP